MNICDKLNSQGAKTAKGNPFGKNSINQIISNKRYIGILEFADIIKEDAFPPIIDKETFSMAQKELEKRKKYRSKIKFEYLLSGKVTCGYCNKSLVGVSGTSRNSNKHYYYQCPDARGKKTCEKKHVNQNWLEEKVANETIKHILQPDMITYIAKRMFEMNQTNKEIDLEIDTLRKRAQKASKTIQNLIKAIGEGIDIPEIQTELKRVKLEQLNIEGEILHLEREKMSFLTEEHFKFFLESFRGADTQKIIDGLVNSVKLWNDKMIIYYNVKKDDDLESSVVEIKELFECSSSSAMVHHRGFEPRTH